MIMDPSTGEGFDTVEVGQDKYFDPNAYSDSWPGVVGLWMISHHWWQGDVAFDTYEEVGPDPQRSVVTGPPDPTATSPAGAAGGLSTFIGTGGEQLCKEDGVIQDLVGTEDLGVTIVLQGAYVAEGTIGDLYFPVPPEELSADFPADNDYEPDVVGLGEITIPGTGKLESIGWTSFFPRDWDPGFCTVPDNLMMAPEDAIVALIWTKRFRLPCRLIIGDTPWNEQVLIKSLKWSVKAGEPGDLYYDIQFKRYRTVSIQSVVTPDAPTDPRDYPTYQGPPPAKAHPVPVKGDVWWNDGTQADSTNPDPQAGDPGSVNQPPPMQPGDTGFIGPPVIGPNGAIVAPPQHLPPASQMIYYDVGVSFNWGRQGLLTGQTLAMVYEDIKKQSDLNTLDSLMQLNKDMPADDHKGKKVVGDYNPNIDYLPWHTRIKYWIHTPDPSTQNIVPGI